MRMENQETAMRDKRHNGVAVIELEKIFKIKTFRFFVISRAAVVIDDTVPHAIVKPHILFLVLRAIVLSEWVPF